MRLWLVGLLAIIAITLTTTFVLSLGERAECLQQCEYYGNRCASDARKTYDECVLDLATCNQDYITDLRVCQTLYDTCRYECDRPPW